MRLLLCILISSVASAASWLTVPPQIVNDPAPKLVFSGNSSAQIQVRVRFTDNTTPTPRTVEKDYIISGSDASNDLARRVYEDRATLQASEVVVPGAVTPIPPTQTETAILDYQIANRRLDALNKLVARMGWSETSVIFVGRTVAQARLSLQNAIKADMTNDARLTLALDNTN